MPSFPIVHLVFSSGKALVSSGPHLYVLNAETGEVAHSTTRLDEAIRERICKSGPVRCVAVDSSLTHVAATADDKKMRIWKIVDGLELVNERELPKKPTELSFTHDGQTIVVSDKFGDVFSYPLHLDTEPSVTSPDTPSTSKRGSLTSHENPSNGTLILGHASLVATFLLSPDERYIITADRDEHIRVSWYPQGYAIERYCLGHEKFVSAIHIVPSKPSILVSGGGDPVLKVWDWMSGRLLADVPVVDVVEPYMKVKAPKRRHWSEGDGAGEGDGGVDAPKQTKGRRRGRRKAKGQEQTAEESRPESADMDEHPGDENQGSTSVFGNDEELVFVVHRIQSVDRGELGEYIIFSVVGATALFYVTLPQEKGTTPNIRAFDLSVPVIDFTVGSNGDVWALVDAEWNGGSTQKYVRLLVWDGSTLSESTESSTLGDTLNTKCPVQTTPEELKALDLYGDLSSMPKNVDPEHDPLIRDTLTEAATMDPETDGKQLTQRELGRLKKKKALLAKIQEKEQAKRGASEAADAEDGEEREIKRTKSESENGNAEDVSGDVEDVEMDAS